MPLRRSLKWGELYFYKNCTNGAGQDKALLIFEGSLPLHAFQTPPPLPFFQQMVVVETVLVLLVAIAGLALLARKLELPYPILLVLGGLAFALVPGLPAVKLDPELVFLFFLPPLLYPAALFTSWRDFRANLRPISQLAFGLVLFTTILVGCLAHWLTGMPLAAGFVLGAIVSPSDAVAATAITQRLRVPQRIVTVLDGESLVNDATALVALRFAITAVATGSFSLLHAGEEFLFAGGGGILFGLGIGWLAVQVHSRVNDPPVQTTLSLLTPFAAYLPADHLGLSGVLAVVSAGLYVGWRVPEIVSARTRLQVGPFWEMIVFLLNGLVFILIGLQLPEVMGRLAGQSRLVLLEDAVGICGVVIVARIFWVFLATYLTRWLIPRVCQTDPYPNWRSDLQCDSGHAGVAGVEPAHLDPLAGRGGRPSPRTGGAPCTVAGEPRRANPLERAGRHSRTSGSGAVAGRVRGPYPAIGSMRHRTERPTSPPAHQRVPDITGGGPGH